MRLRGRRLWGAWGVGEGGGRGGRGGRGSGGGGAGGGEGGAFLLGVEGGLPELHECGGALVRRGGAGEDRAEFPGGGLLLLAERNRAEHGIGVGSERGELAGQRRERLAEGIGEGLAEGEDGGAGGIARGVGVVLPLAGGLVLAHGLIEAGLVLEGDGSVAEEAVEGALEAEGGHGVAGPEERVEIAGGEDLGLEGLGFEDVIEIGDNEAIEVGRAGLERGGDPGASGLVERVAGDGRFVGRGRERLEAAVFVLDDGGRIRLARGRLHFGGRAAGLRVGPGGCGGGRDGADELGRGRADERNGEQDERGADGADHGLESVPRGRLARFSSPM